MALATFSVRMDEDLKRQFDALCADFGMNATTAFNVFARAVVREHRIPFEIQASNREDAQNVGMQAFEELRAQAKENGVQGMTLDEINDEIHKVRYRDKYITYYAVIDTNVLVSALLSSHSDAATVQVTGMLFSGAFVPLFSREIMTEYNSVLRRRKFNFSESTVVTLLYAIEELVRLVIPTSTGLTPVDPKDLPFYEAAFSEQGKMAYLITGNIKHFPDEPFIVTAKEFLNILNRQ